MTLARPFFPETSDIFDRWTGRSPNGSRHVSEICIQISDSRLPAARGQIRKSSDGLCWGAVTVRELLPTIAKASRRSRDAQRTRAAKPMMIRAPEIASAAPTRSVRVGACPSISQSQTSDAAMQIPP